MINQFPREWQRQKAEEVMFVAKLPPGSCPGCKASPQQATSRCLGFTVILGIAV